MVRVRGKPNYEMTHSMAKNNDLIMAAAAIQGADVACDCEQQNAATI